MSDPEGLETLFLVINLYFTESRTDLPREAIGQEGSNCFSRRVCTSVSKTHIATCDFPGRGGGGGPKPLFSPLDPPMVTNKDMFGYIESSPYEHSLTQRSLTLGTYL